LIEFAFAAVGSAHDGKGVAVSDSAQASPEALGDTPVAGVADDLGQLAVADHLAELAAELELVAAVVDRPRVVRVEEHTVFDASDELVHR